MTEEPTPWGTGLTAAAFAAAVVAAAIVVLSLGLIRVHPLLAVGLNLIAVGGLAPTVWGWRRIPVVRWFVLGGAIGVAGGGWRCWRWPPAAESRQRSPLERTPSSTSSHAGTAGRPRLARAGGAWSGAGCGFGVGAASAGLGSRTLECQLGQRSDGTQRAVEVGVDQFGRGVVERGDGAAVRAGDVAEVRDVVGAAGLPGQLDGPAAVLVAPGVPVGVVGVESAVHQRGGDGLEQRQDRGAVGEHRVRGGGELGGPGTFQQDGVGEAFDLGRVRSAGLGQLLDGCSGADPGLNFLGTQHASDLDVDLCLADAGGVTTDGGAQAVVEAQAELGGAVGASRAVVFADDVSAVDVESNNFQISHVDLLGITVPDPLGADLTAARSLSGCDTLAGGRLRAKAARPPSRCRPSAR